MKAFHYLLESFAGVTEYERIDSKTIEVSLSVHQAIDSRQAALKYQEVLTKRLSVDERDQRVLVVFDGELLCESIPRNGEHLFACLLGTIKTRTDHLRKPRFGRPSYRIEEQEEGEVAVLDVWRMFLLLPAGNFVFQRVRDLHSLGPSYVMGEVRKSTGKNEVIWRNSSY